jgi:hypothetical protein
MANPAVTYTFSNSTTADATQINQNFSDIINALTDGTKSLTIDALTCAGAVTLNGHVTLGNGSADDVSILGSLAASVPVKTNNSFDVGSSTLGLAGVYLGAPSSRSTRLLSNQSLAGSISLIMPGTVGNAGDYLESDGTNMSWSPSIRSASDSRNIGITTSVAASALTIGLVGANGSALSSTNKAEILFRNATADTGTPVRRSLTAAPTSLVISSGSTLGSVSATTTFAYIYLVDNTGTVELGISLKLFDEGQLQDTTADDNAGGSDAMGTLYTRNGVALSAKAIRLVGRIKFSEATAGTWATAPSELSLHFERQEFITAVLEKSENTVIFQSPPGFVANITNGGGLGDNTVTFATGFWADTPRVVTCVNRVNQTDVSHEFYASATTSQVHLRQTRIQNGGALFAMNDTTTVVFIGRRYV